MVRIPTPILVDVSSLKPYTKNVKNHPKDQIDGLCELIKLVGFKDPIVIDSDNTIWAGHGRLEAAKKLSMDKVPAVLLENLSEEQKKAFMLMDNRINESRWNKENVQLILDDIPNFDFEEFHLNFDEFRFVSVEEEASAIPEPSIEPESKPGEIYELGNHRIMCGDATKDLDKLYTTKPDLLLTDPPYGINVVQNNSVGGGGPLGFTSHTEPSSVVHGRVVNRRLYKKIIGDDKDFDPIHLLKAAKNLFIFGANNYAEKLHNSSHWLVWDKKAGDHESYIDTFSDAELIWTNLLTRKNVKIYRYTWSGVTRQGDRKSELKERVHPTQKPVGLLVNIIKDYSDENHIILDPYLGSGSTLIACEQTNRICYGMEIDPAYVDVIIQRWENFTGKKAVLVESAKIAQEGIAK